MAINIPKIPVKYILVALSLLLIVGGGVSTSYFYTKYQKIRKLVENPTEASKIEVAALTKKVGKLMSLPQGEDPSVVTVVDIEKLKDQPFFVNAQNGDKTLIYNKAKLAILYSPSKNIILNVSTVTETKTESVKLALYNGAGVSGLTQSLETKLTSKYTNIQVVKKANAVKNDYQESIVVDLTGKNTQMAQELATEIGGKIGTLPEGETSPDGSDILIILGANYIK